MLLRLWLWLCRRRQPVRSQGGYLGPVIERDGKVYEHAGPADDLHQALGRY